MEYDLSIEFLLLIPFNIEETKKLLIHIEDSGFSLLQGFTERKIDYEKASYFLMNTNLYKDEMEFLSLRYENTFIQVFANKDEFDYLGIGFFPDIDVWEKKFSRGDFISIDTHKYIHLFIELLKEYEILKMDVSIHDY